MFNRGETFKNNFERKFQICLEAVKNNGLSLKSVPNKFKTYEICLEAVKNNGLSLEYVSYNYKTLELCTEAIKNNGLALKYIIDILNNKIHQ